MEEVEEADDDEDEDDEYGGAEETIVLSKNTAADAEEDGAGTFDPKSAPKFCTVAKLKPAPLEPLKRILSSIC